MNKKYVKPMDYKLAAWCASALLLTAHPAFSGTWKELAECHQVSYEANISGSAIVQSCTINTYTRDNANNRVLVGTSSVSGVMLTVISPCLDNGLVFYNITQNFPVGVVESRFMVESGVEGYNGCTNSNFGEWSTRPLFDMGEDSPVTPLSDTDSDPGTPDACDCSE
jgi:hypothetical protein